MRIVEVTENKKQYLDLLLLADEQEDMVDRYLYNGKMYVLDDDGVKCECVVTGEGNGILEMAPQRILCKRFSTKSRISHYQCA